MRVLLIILLFLISLAQIAALVPALPISEVPIAAKIAPVVMAIGAVCSAILLIRKSSKSCVPYFAAYATFLVLTVVAYGLGSLPSAGIGLVIGLLFFVPSVRSPK